MYFVPKVDHASLFPARANLPSRLLFHPWTITVTCLPHSIHRFTIKVAALRLGLGGPKNSGAKHAKDSAYRTVLRVGIRAGLLNLS